MVQDDPNDHESWQSSLPTKPHETRQRKYGSTTSETVSIDDFDARSSSCSSATECEVKIRPEVRDALEYYREDLVLELLRRFFTDFQSLASVTQNDPKPFPPYAQGKHTATTTKITPPGHSLSKKRARDSKGDGGNDDERAALRRPLFM